MTATRTEQPVERASVSVHLLDPEDIRLVGAVHVSELMARVPGTWISRGNGQEHLTAIRSPVLTGPGSCGAFYMAEDGIPLRAPGFCNVNQLFDVNTEQAARIEVIRGPGTSVHGANALHGVINVISMAPGSELGGYAALGAGPHQYRRAKFSITDQPGDHAWRLSANATHDGGFKDDAGFRQQKASYRHDYWGTNWQADNLVSYSNLNQDTAGFIEGEDAYKDSSRARENGSPGAFRDSRALRVYSRWGRPVAEASQLQFTPYARYTDMAFLQHFLPGEPLEENGQRSLGLQLYFLQRPRDTIDWRIGADAEYTAAWLQQTQFDSVPWSDQFPVGKQYDYEVDAIAAGLFANADWRLGDYTAINGGLRLDYTGYDYHNRMIDGATAEDGSACGDSPCRYSRPSDRRDSFTNVSLNVGATQFLNDYLALVGNLTRGFRPPQATELYRLQNGQRSADIDSEEIDSIEFGLRGDSRRFSFALVGFSMAKRNVIFQDAERRNVSGAETRHIGVEYSLRWRLLPSWDLALDGTRADHRYASNSGASRLPVEINIEDNLIDTAPQWINSLRLGWDFTTRSRAELEWVHLSDYYLEPANEHRYEGHDLFYLRALHDFSNGFGVAIRLTNLSNTDYAERADFAFGEYRYFVGEPRSAYVELHYEF